MNDIKIPDPHSKKGEFKVTQMTPTEVKEHEPGNKVKVNFKNFVELVATHDFEEVLEKHAEEDVIVSTNLLTDLANAHEEEQGNNKKFPIILISGIIIGVVLAYIVIRFFHL